MYYSILYIIYFQHLFMIVFGSTVWIHSLQPIIPPKNSTNEMGNEAEFLNISRTELAAFNKILGLLSKALNKELKTQSSDVNVKRKQVGCSDVNYKSNLFNDSGVILPIPENHETLTVQSLLYKESGKWSKCTRSCRTKRIRKCRLPGLCNVDYLVEEALCFSPGTKCERKVVEILRHNFTKRNVVEEDDFFFKDQKDDYIKKHNSIHYHDLDEDYYDDDYYDDYDYDHYHDKDYRNRDYVWPDDDYSSNYDWRNDDNYDDYSYGDEGVTYDDYYDEGSANDLSKETPEHKICGISKAAVPKTSFRIIGGGRAVKGAWPWQVAIEDSSGDVSCGGTLIDARWVITAAHCVEDEKIRRLRVKITEHDLSIGDGEVSLRVVKVFVNPHFNYDSMDSDLALLKLNKNAFTTGWAAARKACLPKKGERLPRDKKCVVLGWGLRRESHIYGSDILMYAKVPIVSNKKCNIAYEDHEITKNMFCAGYLRGGPDTCQGDSGGPLLCQDSKGAWVLHGVTSFGEGCGEKGRLGVYVKVRNFFRWINDTIENN